MRTYKIRLLKCSGKDQKISAYLQLLTGLDKVMANRIVSNLPATLFDNLDEEGMEYFKEAFDFYEVNTRSHHWKKHVWCAAIHPDRSLYLGEL